MSNNNTLIVLLGATGVGKTELSLRIAERFSAPIVSADSRQLYRELKIGTAPPTPAQLARVQHFFVGTHSIFDTYSAGQYEADVLETLSGIFEKTRTALLVGGSMMYIDAVCKGLDDIPTVDEKTRTYWNNIYREKGLEYIQNELQRLDPKHFNEQIDRQNPKRIIHALEVCTLTGRPFSELRTGVPKKRDFNILKIGLTRPREELYQRIDARVEQMMEDGLLEEARTFYPFRNLNPLNTVGYKELFEYFDGTVSLPTAIENIKRDTRHYAKRQMTWFNRDKEIRWRKM
ncbi:MAG: tRNA (adenosine(37)-N6)-dimethylallyltransferase MiaA [Prevotellaceae bacterium]|jgi:tRNA dimethylallyltransferase|nr:tRNA (adenosine(37)-N6)-dimethylallyltransferase MiaA [Prevotellaceae bacterium]